MGATKESRRDEIRQLLKDGLNQKEIAAQLQLAASTVCEHVSKIRAAATATVPTAPVPDGFHLSSVNSQLDATGHLQRQWLQAKSGGQGDAVPESGTFPAPQGLYVRSTSTLIDGQTGVTKLQWVKSDIDKEQREAAEKIAFAALCETLPRYVPGDSPVHTIDELLNLYVFTDCHLGMLAWDKETGEDWDIRIAERTLIAAFQAMIANAPKAKYAIIGELGDFLHFDGLVAVTPAHQHVLDADSRFSKVVKVAIRVLRAIVDIALQKHDEVYIVMADANHDPASQVWLRHMFTALYENEPRVKVNDSEKPYYAYQHGKTMVGFHHGHLIKKESLPLVLATLYPEMWGTTTKRYAHVGHLHNVNEIELNGMKVMQHPTIAAKDAYAIRHGWVSQRQASCITYHKSFGEVGRTIVTPEMFE